jgi:hypothetical protein
LLLDAFDDKRVALDASVVFVAVERDREQPNHRCAKNQGGVVEQQGGGQFETARKGCAAGA